MKAPVLGCWECSREAVTRGRSVPLGVLPNMPRGATTALALCAALSVARAAPSEDEVEGLPGWRGPLPSRQWSGYINISQAMGTDMRVHYWCARALARARLIAPAAARIAPSLPCR